MAHIASVRKDRRWDVQVFLKPGGKPDDYNHERNADRQKSFQGKYPQRDAVDIDLAAGNVSHACMELLKQNIAMPKLCSKIVVLLALLSLALPAAAQQADFRRQPRGQNPDAQPNNGIPQVWVNVDVLPAGLPDQGVSTAFPSSAAQNQYAQFAGTWSTEAMPGVVLTLNMNGDFALATPANPEKLCGAGVERGSWTANTETDELQFHIKTDTSGICGLSDLAAMPAIIKTEAGLTWIATDSATGEKQIPLMRAEP